MSIAKLINGAWQVTDIINGRLVTHTYYGYTKREAVRSFRAVNSSEWKWSILVTAKATPPTPHLVNGKAFLCGSVILEAPDVEEVESNSIYLGWACRRCLRISMKRKIDHVLRRDGEKQSGMPENS